MQLGNTGWPIGIKNGAIRPKTSVELVPRRLTVTDQVTHLSYMKWQEADIFRRLSTSHALDTINQWL